MNKQALKRLHSEDGIGMVSAMLVLSLLAVFALVASQLATNERRTSFNEFVHVGSFMSADSGGEAAIGWLRAQNGAPPMADAFNDSILITSRGATGFHDTQSFSYRIDYDRVEASDGNQLGTGGIVDIWYNVGTQGTAGTEGNSSVDSKTVMEGY